MGKIKQMLRIGSMKKRKYNEDFFLSLTITVILYYALFNGSVYAVFDGLAVPGKYIADLLLLLAEGGAIIFALLICVKRNWLVVFFTYSIVCFLYFLTYIIYPENMIILQGTIKNMFVFCVPILCYAYCLENYYYLWKMLEKYSKLMILCGVIYVMMSGSSLPYLQWLGYQLTIPMMIFIFRLFNAEIKLMDWIFMVVGLLLIVLKCSRAPILVLGIYFIICIYYYRMKTYREKQNDVYKIQEFHCKYMVRGSGLLLLVCICTFLGVCIINMQEIAGILYDFCLNKGYNSRTLRVFAMENGLTNSAGRNTIYSVALSLVTEKFPIGYGLAGDCVQLGKALGLGIAESSGMYAHNIVLELMLHFGMPIGCILFYIYIILILIKCRRIEAITMEGRIFAMIVVYVLSTFMVSGSYLTSPVVWFSLGMIIIKRSGICKKVRN